MKAEIFVKESPKEAQDTVAHRLGLSGNYITYYWPRHVFEISLDQSLIIALESQARWRIKNDLTEATEVPNYLNYLYTDALEEVNPRTVTIVK